MSTDRKRWAWARGGACEDGVGGCPPGGRFGESEAEEGGRGPAEHLECDERPLDANTSPRRGMARLKFRALLRWDRCYHAGRRFTDVGMSLISDDLRERALATIQWLQRSERGAQTKIPDTVLLADIVRIVAKARDVPLAIRFVEAVEERSGGIAGPQVYNALLDAVDSRESRLSLDLLERFHRWDVLPPPYFLQGALRRASLAGDCVLTEFLYEHWTECGYGVDSALFLLYMHAYAAAAHPSGVRRVMHEMSLRGVAVDDGHRIALLDAHARCGHTEAAETVFSTIAAPDVIGFTIMLRLYAQKGKVEMMLATVERMKAADVRPDAVSLNPVLHLLLRNRQLSDADRIVDLMRAHRVAPDRAAHTLLMQYYAAKRDSKQLERLIGDGRFDSSNSYMVNTAIKALAEIGDYSAAYTILQSLGERANAWSYHSLLRSVARAGRVEDAFELVGRMWRASIARDSRTYSMLFTACAKQAYPRLDSGKFPADRAMEMLESDTVQPDIGVLNSALEAFISEKKPHYTKKLLSMLARTTGPPDARHLVFCRLAVELVSLTANPRDLLRVVRKYEKLGLASDEALMTAVTRAVELGVRLDNLAVLRIVRRRRLQPGSRLANGVLHRCIENAVYKARNESNDEVLN